MNGRNYPRSFVFAKSGGPEKRSLKTMDPRIRGDDEATKASNLWRSYDSKPLITH